MRLLWLLCCAGLAVGGAGAFQVALPACAGVVYSDWTPCSVSCGGGQRSREAHGKLSVGELAKRRNVTYEDFVLPLEELVRGLVSSGKHVHRVIGSGLKAADLLSRLEQLELLKHHLRSRRDVSLGHLVKHSERISKEVKGVLLPIYDIQLPCQLSKEQEAGKEGVCGSQDCPPLCLSAGMSAWGACSVTCGVGVQTRTQLGALVPAARVLECSKTPLGTCGGPQLRRSNYPSCELKWKKIEHRPCVNQDRPHCPNLVHECRHYMFGPWSSCSVTCGLGLRYRKSVGMLYHPHQKEPIRQVLHADNAFEHVECSLHRSKVRHEKQSCQLQECGHNLRLGNKTNGAVNAEYDDEQPHLSQ